MRRCAMWLAVLVTACVGCAGGDTERSGIVAGMYPAAFLAQELSGEHVEILVEPGVDPHDFELRPKQTVRLHNAELVVTIGQIQPAVDAAAANLDSERVVDLGSVVGDSADRHFWLDPLQFAKATPLLTKQLIALHPEREAKYRQRQTVLNERLTALDSKIDETLQDCKQRTFVTSHDAFGHFAARYDLQQVPITGLDAENEPAPATMAALVRQINELGITTVFTEPLGNQQVAKAVAHEAGVQVALLDPVEGANGDDYFDRITANAVALAKAC